jgi:arabinan endo-1,5-alpha-L-arabinosidase
MQRLLKSALILTSALFIGASFSNSPFALQAAIDHDFPDPGVVKTPDGWYYAYATQTITETRPFTLINIQSARTRDLVHWETLGEVLPEKPSWAKTTQFFWAPDVSLHNGTYYMYFSALPDTQEGFCIGVATSQNAQGPFKDSGHPLVCGSSYENIDAMSFDDPATGQRLLYWGSAAKPIRVRALAEDRLHFEPASVETPVLVPPSDQEQDDYRRLLEGAWVTYHEGFYYLFTSGDNCCGPTHYAVMVSRARSAMGPFEFHPQWKETLLVKADGNFVAPGHNAVTTDAEGNFWILYHAVDLAQPNMANPIEGDRQVRRVLKTQKMQWRNGWPELVPQSPRT